MPKVRLDDQDVNIYMVSSRYGSIFAEKDFWAHIHQFSCFYSYRT